MKASKDKRRLAALLLTFIIAAGLVVIPGLQKASALGITIGDPSDDTLGETIVFDITVDIEDGELLPIEEAYLNVDGPGGSFTISELPLGSGDKTYSTTGGTVEVSATAGSAWGQGYGYRSAEWNGYGYDWGDGYGYGGYDPGYGYGFSDTSITYQITWNSPSDWDEGDYDFEASIDADGETFTTTRTISLNAPAAPTPPGPGPAPAPEPAEFELSNFRVSPSSVEVGESVNIGVTVTNTGGSEGSYTATLGVTGEADRSTTVTLAAGDSERVVFVVTKADPGSYSVSLDGFADDFMVYAPEEVENESRTVIDNINAGGTVDVTVENSSMSSLRITARNSVENVNITVQQQGTAPGGVPDASGTVHSYINVTTEGMSDNDFDGVTISFRVEKSWVLARGIDENTVNLQRFDPDGGVWASLSTELVGEDDTYYYFETTTNHLSTFAISGERRAPAISTEPAADVETDSATLGLSYDFRGYESGQIRFAWRETGGTWNETPWVSTSGSGTYSEDLEGLSSETEYEFRAQISYDNQVSEGSVLTFTTEAVAPNEAPTADAGGPYTVDEGSTVALDGTGSSDPDGTIESYSWEITDGPGSLEDAGTAEPTYAAPDDVDEDTEVTVELTVTDDAGATDTATATVTVGDLPTPFPTMWVVVIAVAIILILTAGAWVWRGSVRVR